MSFETILLSDPHTIALENRALREGVLTNTDLLFSEFVGTKIQKKDAIEDGVLDLFCLYDHLITPTNRFCISNMNDRLNVDSIVSRPDEIRNTFLRFGLNGDRVRSFFDDRNIITSNSIPNITQNEFDMMTKYSSYEAKYILREGIEQTLEHAKSVFDCEILFRKTNLFEDSNVPHRVIVNFFKSNRHWIAPLFDQWFRYGGYNHLIDDLVLKESGINLEHRKWFSILSKSRRFEYYFRYLQESYANTYENAFISQLYDVERAFIYTPTRNIENIRRISPEEITTVIRVNLSDLVEFFPLPRTLEEAVELKNSSVMISFKNILSEWSERLTSTDNVEARIRSELRRANRDIKNLRQYRSLKEHPIFFGIRVALGFIPLVSNILPFFDIAEYVYERKVHKNTAWVVTPKSVR
ncbi:hypothetical protein V5F63_23805 [Xanthobacter autotrophicus DSM 597]|uniref:hypothetical protein n=1 Tax=Xanthobacter wiegelii TaxID=3119913 RepID=UPI00372AB55D